MPDHADTISIKPVITAAEPQLFVADIKASCDFFTGKLGFAVAFIHGEPPFYAASGERRVHPEDAVTVPAATFRKQSWHRQSPPSTGIGRRAVSSSHQHGPDRLHENSVPQPAQARRREVGGFSDRFVMNRIAW
jgi:catechol 2,3-dioxygenase-like lactoylglutathione lyase family enzyme